MCFLNNGFPFVAFQTEIKSCGLQASVLTLLVTALVNMYFPQILQAYLVIALYFTGIVDGVILAWYTLYEGYWKQIKFIEKKATNKKS